MDNKNQLSTTAAADGLQLGSGLRRIVCLTALLFIFVASGVRAAGTYTVTVYNGATISSNDYKALSALCSPLGLMNGNTSGGKTEFLYQSKDHYFTCNTSTYKCSVPATTLPIEKSFPITAYKTILQQSGTYTWLANYDAIKLVLAVAVDGQNFPDTNFRNWVKAQSYGSDGILTKAEIAAVTGIDVSYESISSLKGIEYFTALKELECYNNQLTSLDVSNNTALTTLGCDGNKLTELDVSNNAALTYLYCNDNQLTSLDVSKNTALDALRCSNNQLTSLDVSNNTALYDLDCYNNQLTSLDVSGCTELTTLECYINQLTFLSVSGCTALTWLKCYQNQLTTLDVSGCTALTWLRCYNNQLTTLVVSNNTALRYLYCYENQIRGAGMATLINSLPEVTNGIFAVYDSEGTEGNEITTVQVAAAEKKCWDVLTSVGDDYPGVPGIAIDATNFPDENFRTYVSSNFDTDKDTYLSDDEIAAVTKIAVSGRNITDLKGIEYFTALTDLYCFNNQLTSLDVSKNTALRDINCHSNQLT
ncbi:MAG: hypothetical protein IKG88_03665, partial [Bacteroidales bacterium]|nr:hypothetical protein [Bacteroidales bacterium]